MIRRAALLGLFSLLSLFGLAELQAEQGHAARGVVLNVAAPHHELDVSCDEIPGYMSAMEMSFAVHDSKELAAIKPGMAISFTIVARGKTLYAEKISANHTANFESEPMEAGSLTALNAIVDPAAASKELTVGDFVPDFVLTDQVQKQIHLSQFRGKVVALTFGYSRCPNPNYCFRLSNNLAHVERRFHEKAGRDLILLTIAIDPEHDQGAALTEYANTWKANPDYWHFLTGSLPDVKRTAGMFGMNFWNSEGLLTHSLHTVIIDRKGQLAVNLEGNQFSAKQLGDLIQAVMARP